MPVTAEELEAWWATCPVGDQFAVPGACGDWLIKADLVPSPGTPPPPGVVELVSRRLGTRIAVRLVDLYFWMRKTEGYGWADNP